MIEKTADAKRINWRRPLYAALVALIVFVAIHMCGSDISFFLHLFVVAPILVVSSICVLLYVVVSKNRSRCLPLLQTLVIFWGIGTSLFIYEIGDPVAIRTAARWLVRSHHYKEEVLAQPTAANGDLKHIEWDGWGFAGMDTT